MYSPLLFVSEHLSFFSSALTLLITLIGTSLDNGARGSISRLFL